MRWAWLVIRAVYCILRSVADNEETMLMAERTFFSNSLHVQFCSQLQL